MGGGDLNMKKSWHPLLMKNQERVWLEEKKALEERKKLDQLRKEKDEERQLQELQRLQEEQTGRKRTEKLDWMYSTPASGTGASSNDLEEYLLGRKRVDKLLTGDDNKNLGASHKTFIAVQNANTVKDTASKIREDPLFAIKQQEQHALQALLSNPLKLQELQERNGLVSKKHKEKRHDRDRKDRKRKRSSRSRSPRRRSYDEDDGRRRRDSRSPVGKHRHSRRNSRSPVDDSRRPRDRKTTHGDERRYRRSESPARGEYSRRRNRSEERPVRSNSDPSSSSAMAEERSESPHDKKASTSSEEPRQPQRPAPVAHEDERAKRLAAMQDNAASAHEDRKERLSKLLEQEKAELELEERARLKSKGYGNFLSVEQKRVYGGMKGGLGEHMRRGKMGMVID